MSPVYFGEQRHPETYGIDAKRDLVEVTLTRWAMQDDKPAFSICRGIQVVNVALGGTLIQDIPTRGRHPARWSIGHKIGAARRGAACGVREPNCRLASIIGAGDVGTNSFHHQAVGRVGDGLVVTSPHRWHHRMGQHGQALVCGRAVAAEEMTAGRADMMALFQSFVHQVGEGRFENCRRCLVQAVPRRRTSAFRVKRASQILCSVVCRCVL